MAKLTEIKKIINSIKEIVPTKKETLEEEVENMSIAEKFQNFNLMLQRNASSTLTQTKVSQEISNRQRRIEKQDEVETNFKPVYTGEGKPYRESSYTPVGSSESGAVIPNRALDKQTLRQQNEFNQRREDFSQNDHSAGSYEMNSKKSYVGQQDKREQAHKRRNM